MSRPRRLAFVVSHPIQYYAPLYQRLAVRKDIDVRVFFTWHAGESSVLDRGFEREVAWDLPLVDGYGFERVPNVARDLGTHHFLGLQNPSLLTQVQAWSPDVVHVTGWAWWSHLRLMRRLRHLTIPVLFRGDSHLLDERLRGPRWWVKQAVLRRVYSWPTAFLVVGQANRAYYEAFGVRPERLLWCPHSIDVARFAEPKEQYESQAAIWRRELRIDGSACVILFAGKFEAKKQPIVLMRSLLEIQDSSAVLVMVGGGELESQVREFAAAHPTRFRVLPFQNQSQMPIVYRLGGLFVLPSAYGETWGLAVNEALACGRPVLVSDHVGCAVDVVTEECGQVYSGKGAAPLTHAIRDLVSAPARLAAMRTGASIQARRFDLAATEVGLLDAVAGVLSK